VQREKTVRFCGRRWRIRRVDADDFATLPRDKLGIIDCNDGILTYRKTDDEGEQITILHEVLHFAFPRARESDVDRADWILKDALEAFGVDLSPMIDMPKKRASR